MSKRNLATLAELGRDLVRRSSDDRPTNRGSGSWMRIENRDGDVARMYIYGVIGDNWGIDDVTAGDFTRKLDEITAPVIELHLNSSGGLIFDGVAIYTAIKSHPARVNVLIDGLAASAASFVAMAGDDIAIAKPARLMVHDASGGAVGNASDHQEMATLLDELSQTIAQVYADRAGGTADEWREAMRAETWYDSEKAVSAGLADRVADDGETEAVANSAIKRHEIRAQARDSQHEREGAMSNSAGVEEVMASLKGIVDGAEGRPLTDDEVKRYEALEVDLANKRTEAVKSRMRSYEEPAPANYQAAVHVAPPKQDNGLADAFNAYLRTGKPNQDISELRNSQSVGTGSEGGFTAPEGFRIKLVDRLKAFGGLATEAETITTDTGNRLPWPTLDDTSNEGVITAEGAAPGSGGADLVFGERELNAFKYTAPGATQLPLRVSVELLQDSAFNIEEVVIRKLGERIARAQASDWVTATGTGEPQGITQSGGASQTFAGATPSKDELIDAIHTVDPDYRMNAVWVFNDATLGEIRKLEDGNGRPLWLPLEDSGLTNAPGGVLLGHRVVIDQAFDNYTDASSNVWGVFGDVREGYVIRRVRDIQVVVNPWSRANEGQVEYTLWARADGAIQNENSFSLLSNDAA